MNHTTRNLPTLQQIRREHNITSRAVAEEAGVDFRTEYRLEIGAAVERDDALKILSALSALTGERCAVETSCAVGAPQLMKKDILEIATFQKKTTNGIRRKTCL